MKQIINPDFDIPHYIFDEIVEYIEQTANGRCRCMKWENIRGLLRCAVTNRRLTERQSEHLEKKYCREKESVNE